jgi:formiminotetrahydrofolate cyclodeaminase
MVCALTQGKKKYADYQDLTRDAGEQAQKLKDQFVDVINRDTEAFHGMSAVFAMPKGSEAEKAARAAAMEEALKTCTQPPFAMMRLSLQALELTETVVGKSNVSAASDLGCAALGLKAAMQSAWLNVLINIGGIKDSAFAEKYRMEGEALLEKALPLADRIYETVKNAL